MESNLTFVDGETVHFIQRDEETYVFPGDVPEWLKPKTLGTAVIERVDSNTNTIWFTLPEDLNV